MERAGRMGQPGRPDRPERVDRGERMENRPERPDRGDRAERDRRMMGQARPHGEREQSSRPPPAPIQTKAKDPMKLVGLKSNIKLSLISKAPVKPAPSAAPASAEPPKAAAAPAASASAAAAAKPKKSMSSRREELLKQLKAVEDAIARKKAKMQ
nr:hypothetical protein BaRGS_014531 [Batillaria attramentaria]